MTPELEAGPNYAKKTISLEGNLLQIPERINVVSDEFFMDFTIVPLEPVPQEGVDHKFKRRAAKAKLIPVGAEIKENYDRIRLLDDRGYPRVFVTVDDLQIEIYSAAMENDSVIAQCKITRC